MNALTTCVLGAVLFVSSIAGGPQRGELRFNAWHHEYIGIAACGLGVVTHGKLLTQVGAFIALDDGVQHAYQRINYPGMGDAAFQIHSPLHIGYQVTLAKLPLVGGLNRFLDNLLR